MMSEGEIWKLEKDLCRCCHAEGTFENLATPQTFMNEQEIYSDMLRFCFDINISPVPGELCAVTYTICPNCIVKLRDANTFKRQVELCEEKFLELHYRKAIRVKIPGPIEVIKDEPEVYYPDAYNAEEFSPDEDADEDDDEDEKPQFSADDDDDWDEDMELDLKKEDTLKKEDKLKKRAKPKSPAKGKAKAREKKREVKEPKKKESVKKEGGLTKREEQYCTVRDETDGSRTYSCNICSNTFKRKDSIKQHYRHVHLKQRPKLHGCYYCPEKVGAHLRAQHMEAAHGIPAPTCGACGKKFAFPFQVVRHQKTFHMGEKNFACPMCKMSFGSKANLRQHVIKHTTERPFKCDFCDEAFKWKKHLRRHVAGHLNQKKR